MDLSKTAKKRKGTVGTVFFVIILAIAIVGVFLYVTRDKEEKKFEPDVNVTTAKKLIDRNFSVNYPQTPREVVKCYCDIAKCLYNDELTDDEIEQLVKQIRCLYSTELILNNPLDEMIGLVRGEIAHYHSNNMTINSSNVDDASAFKHIRTAEGENIIINMYFTIKKPDGFDRAYEEFVMVQDDVGLWKIAGWKASEAVSAYSDD